LILLAANRRCRIGIVRAQRLDWIEPRDGVSVAAGVFFGLYLAIIAARAAKDREANAEIATLEVNARCALKAMKRQLQAA
jgi:hypothetical protein